MAQNKIIRQHEPIRVPENWSGQSRALVRQIDLLFTYVYAQIGEIEARLKKLEEDGGNE